MRDTWGPPATSGWPSFCSECGAKVAPGEPLCPEHEALLVAFLTADV